MEEVVFKKMEWPALSPDMNSIEYLWNKLKHMVKARNPASTTINELKIALVEEWFEIL